MVCDNLAMIRVIANTGSVFITANIDAFENRDGATVDMPSVFLHIKVDPNDDIVYIVL